MNRDTVSGVLLSVLGLAVSVYADQAYSIGSLANMSPGFFPFYLGITLLILGALIAAVPDQHLDRQPDIEYINMATIAIGVILYASLLTSAGLIVSVLISGVVVTYASHNYNGFFQRFAVVTVIAVINWLLFVVVLGMNIPTLPLLFK